HPREQGATKLRWLDATWPSVEQFDAQRYLKARDDSGDGRLRDAELNCCLRHASPASDREEDVELSQLEAAADVLFPMDMACHSPAPMEIVTNRIFYL